MTKAHNRKYCVLTGIIILLGSIFIYIMMPRGEPVIIKKDDLLFKIAEDGDIICRLGDRLWSRVFMDISNDDKRFSHMGVIRIKNDIISVIHAEGTTIPEQDYVKEESLDDFLKVARSIGVYRINDFDRSVISDFAMEYLDTPFDWQFDMYDESKLYCTELLYAVFKKANYTINLITQYVKELKKDIIPLDAISNSEYFSEVYFLDIQ